VDLAPAMVHSCDSDSAETWTCRSRKVRSPQGLLALDIDADVAERIFVAIQDTDVAAGKYRICDADRGAAPTLSRTSGAAGAGMRELGFRLSPASAARRFCSLASHLRMYS